MTEPKPGAPAHKADDGPDPTGTSAEPGTRPSGPEAGATRHEIAHWAAKEALRSTEFTSQRFKEELEQSLKRFRVRVMVASGGGMVAVIAIAAFSLLAVDGELEGLINDRLAPLVAKQEALAREVAAIRQAGGSGAKEAAARESLEADLRRLEREIEILRKGG